MQFINWFLGYNSSKKVSTYIDTLLVEQVVPEEYIEQPIKKQQITIFFNVERKDIMLRNVRLN